MRGLFLLMLLLALPVHAETLLHDGVERSYTVRGATPNAPALLVLHGGGGSGARVRRYSAFDLAEKGWVEIYPDAVNKVWNDGRTGRDGDPLRSTDDVGFLARLIDRLAMQGRIDRNRVFVTGPSNGGAMTLRLLCQTDLVAGAVVLIMTQPVGLPCPASRARPMMFILGTQDRLVPFHGGPVGLGRKDRGHVQSAAETLTLHAERNGCGRVIETKLPDAAPHDQTRVRHLAWTDCTAPLDAYIVEGGGHTWPGARDRPRLRWLLGRTTRDVSATALIQDFFNGMTRR